LKNSSPLSRRIVLILRRLDVRSTADFGGNHSGVQTDSVYNSVVPIVPLARDTSPEIERLQISSWRQMSAAEKASAVSGLTGAACALALAGVRYRHPDASPREQLLRLAVITLGLELAGRAYPEIAALDLR
jgi:hypothetical protein